MGTIAGVRLTDRGYLKVYERGENLAIQVIEREVLSGQGGEMPNECAIHEVVSTPTRAMMISLDCLCFVK